jgi:glutamine amidotransferase-like uncharacterized protein
LILGLTLTFGVYSASAATVTSTNNSNLTSQGTTNLTHTSVKTTTSSVSKNVVSTSYKPIKVLIYNGNGAINSCVVGVENGLTYANSKNLVPGYRFSYKTTKTINSAVLSGYNVLVMPGGSSGLNYIKTINSYAIKQFVSSGHGYVGICAGAYSGSKYVEGLYSGWGLAPHVYCKHVTHEGKLLVSINSAGKTLFGTSGYVPLAHYNGPAMYAHGGSIVTFATYADGSTGYKGYAAIVGDYYGKGRTVLSGPHPELQPRNPSMLAKLVAWAAKVGVTPVTQSISVTSANPAYGSVNVAANKVITINFNNAIKYGTKNIQLKNSNGILIPTITSISGSVLSIRHSLLSKGVKYTIVLGSGSITDLSGKGISAYSSSFTVSALTLAQMKDGISRVQAFYKTNNRLPSYVSFGTQKILIAQFKEIISAYGLRITL